MLFFLSPQPSVSRLVLLHIWANRPNLFQWQKFSVPFFFLSCKCKIFFKECIEIIQVFPPNIGEEISPTLLGTCLKPPCNKRKINRRKTEFNNMCTSSMGFLGGSSVVKNLPVNAGDVVSIPGSGKSPGGWHGYPLQYSCLENPMDREAWQARVHRVTKSQTQLRLSTYEYTLQLNNCNSD